MKPLFIPLNAEFFRAFERGDKTVEYRRYCPRWHEGTCVPGRDVVLSCGYSGPRLVGTIVYFDIAISDDVGSTCYGPNELLAAITITVHKSSP